MKLDAIKSQLLKLTIFLIPFYFFRFSIFGIRTNVFEVAVLVCLILSALGGSLKCHLDLKKRWLIYLGGFLILVGLLTGFLRSADHLSALGQIKGWFVVPGIFGWLVYQETKKIEWHRLLVPLYWSMIVVSVWAILQKFGVISTLFYQVGDAGFSDYLNSGSIRAFGPFESPNYLAMFLVPVLLLVLPLYDAVKDRKSKISFSLSLILPILAIIFADSRAGILSLGIGAVLFLVFQAKSLSKLKFRIPAMLILAVVAVWLISGNHAGSNDARLQIYSYAWQLVSHNWFLGIGLADFQAQVGNLAKIANNQSFILYTLQYAIHPHNLYLALWLNLGISGLAGFFLLIIGWYRKVLKLISKYAGAAVIVSMLTILIHGIFDTSYLKNDLSAIFWLIFFLGLYLREANND